MQKRVLVAYASKYGSTQEVAIAIAETLQEKGLMVDLEPMTKVQSLKEYTSVVLGAPLYVHWHKDARNFLSKHRDALTELQVAVFTLGPLHNEEEEWNDVRAQFDKELAKFPWLKPSTMEIFGGKFDPKKIRFPDSLISRLPASPLHNMPASDIRDWEAIRDWASDLATRFQLPLSQDKIQNEKSD